VSDEKNEAPRVGEAPPGPGPNRGTAPGVIGGIVLICLGLVFMLQSYVSLPANWWTVFIYIPAAANLYFMFRSWKKEGRFTQAATGSLTGALVLTTVASIFALGLDWAKAWPAILISIGAGLIIGGVLGRK
jgi:low temperature requirement protein LtrA